MEWQLLTGDVRETLSKVPTMSVQCCVTSPPYWALRDYGDARQIGMESTPAEYVESLVSVFRDVRRVMKSTGTLWLNLGDTYASDCKGTGGLSHKQLSNPGSRFSAQRISHGLKTKDLIGIPWRVALALQADGWYLRSDIIWSKPNPMPESVTDRPTKAHEYLFLLTKQPRYYYDADAIAEAGTGRNWLASGENLVGNGIHKHKDGYRDCGNKGETGEAYGRNRRSVWTIAVEPYHEAHFATYPELLVEPCILAGSNTGDVVIDPFAGSGTTGVVALKHQRNFIGCELNPAYVRLAENRLSQTLPLLTTRVPETETASQLALFDEVITCE